MATDPTTGQTQTATTPFVVASGDSAPEVSTGSAIPATGNFETTVILLITGVIFSLVGVTLPLFIQ
jgi:uncharacterized surface anchored protein